MTIPTTTQVIENRIGALEMLLDTIEYVFDCKGVPPRDDRPDIYAKLFADEKIKAIAEAIGKTKERIRVLTTQNPRYEYNAPLHRRLKRQTRAFERTIRIWVDRLSETPKMTFEEANAIAMQAWRDWCAYSQAMEHPASEECWYKWRALYSAWEQAWEIQHRLKPRA